MNKEKRVIGYECPAMNTMGDNGPYLILGIRQIMKSGLSSDISKCVIMVDTEAKTVKCPKSVLDIIGTEKERNLLKDSVKKTLTESDFSTEGFEFFW